MLANVNKMPKRKRKNKVRRERIASRTPVVDKSNQSMTTAVSLSNEEAMVVKRLTLADDYLGRYKYVRLELKRIAIIAGSLFIVLIILYFVL